LIIENLPQAYSWETEMKKDLNAILGPVQKPPIPGDMSIQDYLKSVLPGLSAESLDRNLGLLAKNDIHDIGAVRLTRECDLTNLGLSEPVLGSLLKVQ
jgi:hypothetical protein